MILRTFRIEFSNMLKQRRVQITLLILFTLIGLNYVDNVLMFRGSDAINMYHPMMLLLLSYGRGNNISADMILFFIQLYPLLVSLPAGTVLTKEQQMGINVLTESRIGTRQYVMGKLLAVFTVTGLVFTIPFLCEICLNCLAFPLNAEGMFVDLSAYDAAYLESVRNYLMPKIFELSPYLYAVCHTVLFGFLSGLLGAFAASVSSLIRFKYQILCLLPTYLLLQGGEYLRASVGRDFDKARWYNYFLLFSDFQKSEAAFITVVAAFSIMIIIFAYQGSRKDCLS